MISDDQTKQKTKKTPLGDEIPKSDRQEFLYDIIIVRTPFWSLRCSPEPLVGWEGDSSLFTHLPQSHLLTYLLGDFVVSIPAPISRTHLRLCILNSLS